MKFNAANDKRPEVNAIFLPPLSEYEPMRGAAAASARGYIDNAIPVCVPVAAMYTGKIIAITPKLSLVISITVRTGNIDEKVCNFPSS